MITDRYRDAVSIGVCVGTPTAVVATCWNWNVPMESMELVLCSLCQNAFSQDFLQKGRKKGKTWRRAYNG